MKLIYGVIDQDSSPTDKDGVKTGVTQRDSVELVLINFLTWMVGYAVVHFVTVH